MHLRLLSQPPLFFRHSFTSLHLLLSELIVNPALHPLHMLAPCLGQAVPVVG